MEHAISELFFDLIRLIIMKYPIAFVISLTYTERGMSAMKIMTVNSFKCS